MRQRLYHRLGQLEAEHARVRSFRDEAERLANRERAYRKIRLFLRMRGVEQTGMESMFDAFARALGVGTRQLRAQMVVGVDPIKKYFAEAGIYGEIERRKAAGTWPAAERIRC